MLCTDYKLGGLSARLLALDMEPPDLLANTMQVRGCNNHMSSRQVIFDFTAHEAPQKFYVGF